MGLSVIMIVKNEQEMLAACLDSVVGADELIVVDTGSTDRTKEIAASYGAKLFDFTWCDDWAAARNFSRDQATGEWILFIDADERLSRGGMAAIYAAMDSPQEQMFLDLWNGGSEHTWAPRVFRNLPHQRWSGIVHECLPAASHVRVKATVRYGRSPAHDDDPDRYIRQLTKAITADPTSARYRYYFGRDHYYHGKWELAVEQFDYCLQLSTWLPERADAYLLKARCLWNLQRGDEARAACMNALTINANFKEAARLMAQMSWPANAVQWNAMAANATNDSVLFIRNIG